MLRQPGHWRGIEQTVCKLRCFCKIEHWCLVNNYFAIDNKYGCRGWILTKKIDDSLMWRLQKIPFQIHPLIKICEYFICTKNDDFQLLGLCSRNVDVDCWCLATQASIYTMGGSCIINPCKVNLSNCTETNRFIPGKGEAVALLLNLEDSIIIINWPNQANSLFWNGEKERQWQPSKW